MVLGFWVLLSFTAGAVNQDQHARRVKESNDANSMAPGTDGVRLVPGGTSDQKSAPTSRVIKWRISPINGQYTWVTGG